MTYTVYAFNNDRSQLCTSKTVTDDPVVACYASEYYERQGYIAKTQIEE